MMEQAVPSEIELWKQPTEASARLTLSRRVDAAISDCRLRKSDNLAVSPDYDQDNRRWYDSAIKLDLVVECFNLIRGGQGREAMGRNQRL